jgi:phenylpropionate dioxygenase-like ring-hydroxylating dioxygenase large terminal subunit
VRGMRSPTAPLLVAAAMSPIHEALRHCSPHLQISEVTADAGAAVSKLNYDWHSQWYAVGYADDLPCSKSDSPCAYSVFDEPLVLWHDGEALRCADDRCPHRLAALSEGAVEPDGSLRCFYHGWAFSGSGGCTAIPQLPKGAAMPGAACIRPYELRVRESIVWVWMGAEPPAFEPPASPDDLDANSDDFDVYDFVVELPYDHSYLVENLADPAHIPISHDRTPGGGKRENAEAYVMELDKASVSPKGFKGRFRPESKPEAWQARAYACRMCTCG